MHRVHLARIIIGAILLLAPGVSIGIAWPKIRRLTSRHAATKWNSVNLAVLLLLTGGYLYFISAVILLFTPWRESFTHWQLYSNAVAFAEATILVGIVGGALGFCGRGAARVQITFAAILVTLMSLFLLYGMTAD
jgi:hypothetical protein